MPRRSRSAWRRRFARSRKQQVAVTALGAVAAVLVAVVCITLVDQHVQSVNQAAYDNCASAPADPASPGDDPDPGASAAASPCPSQTAVADPPSATASADPGVLVSPDTYANGPVASAQLGDVASAPVDGQGDAISLHQSPAEAAASGNCTLIVPSNPLTAAGLATPYQLSDGCSEANPGLEAFVEATILSPGGQLQVYDPLVITRGTRPAARPVPPKIARGSRVVIMVGFNGTNLALTGPGAHQQSSGCVDALGQSLIGQVSACDAVPFFNLANAEIASGKLKVPALGTSLDGQQCQDTRNFALIDQDQSDNTYSQYLLNADGQTAQATAANAAAMGGATTINNGSDNALLGDFVDPTNGCTPFEAADPTNPAGRQSSQALDELSAKVNQTQEVAVVPTNDEMVLVGGDYSIAKTNVYRSLVDQPQLASNVNPTEVAAAYCMNMVNIAPARNQLDMSRDEAFASPVPATGDNLATFLGNRLSMSFQNLGCQDFGLTDPVNVTTDGNGVATAVSYDTGQQQATIPAPAATAQPTSQGGKWWRAPSQGHDRHHKIQDPSGM